jgi:uncharacterized membrane protein YfcA
VTLAQVLVLFVAAGLGGALNSVAGGGSFLTFPALAWTGVPLIQANATSTMALWPGSLASVGAYRRELAGRRGVRLLGAISLVGGALGALVLLSTPQATFQRLLPYLLLGATLIFAFGGRVAARLRRRRGPAGAAAKGGPESAAEPAVSLVWLCLIQAVISFYGGFFGGGIGILMLAGLALAGMEDIHAMNAVKTLLAVLINGVAVVIFVWRGAIFWPEAAVMVAGAIAGGYGGAHYARRLPPLVVRRGVLAVGCALTVYFFYRAYLA